jgi:hypothetical protein
MTPLEIKLLLHCYCTPTKPDLPSEVHKSTIDWFLDNDFIQQNTSGGYSTTSRGTAYVQALMSIPYPQKAWRVEMPSVQYTDGHLASINGGNGDV